MTRTTTRTGRVLYRPWRLDWYDLGWKIGGRLAVAVFISFIWAMSATYSWPWQR